MPIPSQLAAAEQARRTIGRIVAGADNFDMRTKFRIALTIIRGGLCRYNELAVTASMAIAAINQQTELAVELREVVIFRIRPVFPTITVASVDLSTYA